MICGSPNPESFSSAAVVTNKFFENQNFLAHADNSIITRKFKGSFGKQMCFAICGCVVNFL